MYGRIEQSWERCGRGTEGRGQGTGRDDTGRQVTKKCPESYRKKGLAGQERKRRNRMRGEIGPLHGHINYAGTQDTQ